MLEIVERTNPALIESTCRLHQRGDIPPDCYVVDLEVVRENAARLAERAEANDLRIYAMTKQFNRNPSILEAISSAGVEKFVAVDIEGARAISAQGLDVAHVGHLSQIPRFWIPEVLSMRPDVWTVYGHENAKAISEAATARVIRQDLLLKVTGPDDFTFAGQEGGIPVKQVVDFARNIRDLPGVRIVGVTGFPTVDYDHDANRLTALPNMATVVDAARRVQEELGIEMPQINCPGNSSCASMDLIAAHGGTDAEPGSAFWGMAPQQLFGDDVGRPGQVYLTEVSHRARDRVMVYGGGFYPARQDGPWAVSAALVGDQPDSLSGNRVPAEIPAARWIDYYAWLYPDAGQIVRPGDSAIFFFRPQVFNSRSAHVAAIEGVQQGEPTVISVHDKANRRIR
ncbi:MAG: YhfX family PLP-dependent enzyme [Chloroflexi bacterium]|nr:alanine racemase [Chloroflexota bacterium]MXX65576.1 YhfX family PLP-dependent enzyme [Chloroflexota bacterium]